MSDIEERAKTIYGQISMNGVQHYNIGMEHYIKGATEQKNIEIAKLKSILNALMIDTKDKAEIIKMMEQ